ncbi:outer membrane beta-barrel protein [Dysgonomonas termitidis]|uniref:Outer membrane beta-barrel protein n=1 Tax=Dysgonomonas termitidis TaxID=1516126 RepID=A0ABV9L0A4_9BACT
MKYFLFTLFASLFANTANLHANFILSGKIIDSIEHTPIEFANIVILSPKDSTFVSGTITDEEGYFKIDKLEQKEYILKISFIGYNSYFKNIILRSDINNLEDIMLAPSAKMLNEIVVTPKEVPFKLTGNSGLIANVSTSLLNSVGTANDVIQRMPGIIVTDNNISVLGKGNPIIYVNNRRLNDNQELERIESSEISTIELLTNPGAKYDASGRAVLIIKTKKKQNGFSFQITERLRQAAYLGDNENVNIAYSTSNLNLFASYYHLYGKMKTNEKEYIRVTSDNLWEHDLESPYKYTNDIQQINLGLDWNINDKHAVGGQYQYYFQSSRNWADIKGKSVLNSSFYDEYIANSFIKEKPYKHIVNAFYKGSYNNRFSLQIDLDYIKNHGRRDQNTEEVSNMENRIVNTLSQSDYDLYAMKMTNNYKSTIGLLEFGGEYNNISGSGFMLNPEGYTKNNIYTTNEQKAAAFINYSKEIGGFGLTAGLRYEYTHIKATQDSIKTTKTNQIYNALYPSFSIAKNIEDVQLSLRTTKRVQRPNFSDLNGNTIYLNRFLLQTGNPYLKKVDIFDMNIQANYKMFYINVGYTYEKNPITFTQKEEDNSESIILAVDNFPKYQELNIISNFSHEIGRWYPNYTIGIRAPFFSVDYLDRSETYNKTDLSFRAYNDFTLPYNFILSLNFSYQSNFSYYLMDMRHYEKIDLGLRKSFFENRLKLNLEIRDVFNWVKEGNVMKVNNVYFDQYKKRETRYGQLTITYLFNNYKKKYRGSNAAKDDINRF